MADFTKTELNRLSLESLEDENITPKEDYPLVWKVGNKNITFSQIESLYKMAKLRADDFEERIK